MSHHVQELATWRLEPWNPFWVSCYACACDAYMCVRWLMFRFFVMASKGYCVLNYFNIQLGKLRKILYVHQKKAEEPSANKPQPKLFSVDAIVAVSVAAVVHRRNAVFFECGGGPRIRRMFKKIRPVCMVTSIANLQP